MSFALATRTPVRAAPPPRLLQAAVLYDRVRGHIPKFEWDSFAEDAAAIERLKVERDAIVLAHNYQTPEIYHGVADIVGDSLALAREAGKTSASVIVLAGVHFMPRTAKILNPDKTVLNPGRPRRACSLAEEHHRRRRAPAQGRPSRPAGGHLRQHLSRGEGGDRRLLHLRQRPQGG